jgi:uncharacterized oligopeptide transporter (OPT) family protein
MTLMVVASLTSVVLVVCGLPRPQGDAAQEGAASAGTPETSPLRHPAFIAAALTCAALVVIMQVTLFDIGILPALLAVPISGVLGIVAARVVGETGIPPIGALGKVSQLSFGVIAPANVTANLMTANVAGGTAGQCADLLNDLKTGAILRATPGAQIIAQFVGVATGSVVGAATYLLLVPDPVHTLLTARWPAPAVATWKAVAETLQHGLGAIPLDARIAMAVAAVIGLMLALAATLLPPSIRRWVPSAPAVGLAFVLPAWNSLSMCLGAVLAALLSVLAPVWARRFLMATAAGLVAGESLAGIATIVADLYR